VPAPQQSPQPAAARSGSIRVLIADDHPLVRAGVRAVLGPHDDLSVVGEAADGAEAIRLALQLKPDILLLDLSMPARSGVDVIRELNAAEARCRTVILTASVDQSDIVELLKLGARGVVLKASSMTLLVKSIRKVHEGELWLGREAVADVVTALTRGRDDATSLPSSPAAPPAPDIRLTARERETLALVVEGDSNKDIARRLKVTENTVKHHLTSIFDKAGVSNRLELALYAIRHRLAPG
jgi:two-component system, NarL family, nitrate/nitrite response regulator NarL